LNFGAKKISAQRLNPFVKLATTNMNPLILRHKSDYQVDSGVSSCTGDFYRKVFRSDTQLPSNETTIQKKTTKCKRVEETKLKLIPAVLFNPVNQTTDKIIREHRATLLTIRYCISYAYCQLREIKSKRFSQKLETDAKQMKKYKDLIAIERDRMRQVVTQTKQELSKMKTTNIFRYLTKRGKGSMIIAMAHQFEK
jgi:hypothetical protein